MLVSHRYFNIPVKMGAVIEQMDIWIGDKMVRNMEVELGGDEPDYWVTLEVKDWIGLELRIEASKSPNVEQALKLLRKRTCFIKNRYVLKYILLLAGDG